LNGFFLTIDSYSVSLSEFKQPEYIFGIISLKVDVIGNNAYLR